MAKCFLAYDFGYELDLDGVELRDIAVAVQDKIARLQDRRERYHEWLKCDAPADYVPNGLMWSQYDEERLQRLENLMAEIADRGAVTGEDLMVDHTAEVAAEELIGFETVPEARSYVLASEIWKQLELFEEFGCSGAVLLQKSVFDGALSLLRHFRAEKADQIEAGHKMAAFVPKQLRVQLDNQFSEAEGLLKSLDDVLPYLDGAFTVNFHPGSNTAAGKEEA